MDFPEQVDPGMNTFEENRRMSVGRWSAIGGTLVLLGVAAALILRTGVDNEPVSWPLGPHDGQDLSGLDTGRVAVGDVAPDFSLVSYAGPVTTLSDFRGEKTVVLQFYRGHW